MGLDGIELVMDVEDRFGISIRDDEAERIVTVGDLTQLVLSRIAARERHVCPTLRSFLMLRADVRQLMADGALRIRPHQRIVDVIPNHHRRAFWQSLEQRLGTAPPSLQRPAIVRKAIWLIASVLFILALAPAGSMWPSYRYRS